MVQGQPVRVHDLVENIRLNVIVDVNAHLGGDPADDTVKGQAENSASHHNRHHNPQSAGVIAGNDVDHVFAGHTADQPQGSAENAQKQIKKNSPFVTEAVAEDPFPVV